MSQCLSRIANLPQLIRKRSRSHACQLEISKIKETNKKQLWEKIEKVALKWSPYRTYACLYLWGWKDGE